MCKSIVNKNIDTTCQQGVDNFIATLILNDLTCL